MSMQRRCDIWKATDGLWYMVLGKWEYAEEDRDCQTYGPFATEKKLRAELGNHSNPGGCNYDDSGTVPPPQRSLKPLWATQWE